jgi:gluconate 2-dehydrogenase alpha chain
MQRHPETDACVIGLGAAGGIIAAELAKAGLAVVGLEAGPFFKREEFENQSDAHDELAYVRQGKLRWNEPEVLIYNNQPSLTFPVIARNIGVGGPLHWSCFSYRFHESDFRVKTRNGAPRGSSVEDWPITYDDLEPYYERAEYEFGVAGQTDSNPFSAPRSRPFPLPPLTRQLAGQVFADTAKRLGYHPFPIPAAITTLPNYGGKAYRQTCNYCGKCTYYGCEQHAKGSNLVVTLPEALATGLLDVRANCTAAEIRVDETGRAKSVIYFDGDGKAYEQPARLVVTSNNAAYVAHLLLLSKSDRFPRGLANSSGLVGKNLMFHASVFGYGIFEDREMYAINGPQATVAFDDLNEDRPRQSHGQKFIRGGVISGGLPLAFTGGPLAFASALGTFIPLPKGVPTWGKDFKSFLTRYYKSHFAVSALCEDLPVESNRIEPDTDLKDDKGIPALKIIYSDHQNTVAMQRFMKGRIEELLMASGASHWSVTVPTMMPGGAAAGHVMGTTRMGADPKRSVVNQYCQSHDVFNLFVGGSSTFVTAAGVNPTLTIFALAYRTSEQIIRLWREGAFTQ